VRRVLTSICVGALVGIILTTWLGPRILTWWFTPPAGVMLTNASEAVRWGMDRLVHAQVISLLIGALLGLVAGVLLFRRKGALPPPRESAPASPAPQKTTTSA
jgi:F0F1-type ATP synthase assembly protein I